jgi:hypothetical protein
MPASSKLRTLMFEAATDPTKEPEVWKALLDAILYVHMPFHEKAGSLLFHQFVRPDDGRTVLPVFTDREQADRAAAGALRVVPMLGRTILQATLGALIQLDPNRIDCVLFPEEIALILQSIPTGTVTQWTSEEGQAEWNAPANDVAPDLINALVTTASKCEFIEAMYLLYVKWRGQDRKTLLVMFTAAKSEHERAVRALAPSLQPFLVDLPCHVDMGGLAPSDADHPAVKHGTRIYPYEPKIREVLERAAR